MFIYFHCFTIYVNIFYIFRSMSCEEKNYLDSCKKMVEVDHDIKEVE